MPSCVPTAAGGPRSAEGTIQILHTLGPLIVVKAGADLFDPYKD
jgi:hypothetical protein